MVGAVVGAPKVTGALESLIPERLTGRGSAWKSTRFGTEEPSAPTIEAIYGQSVGAWLSLAERPVRDRKVAGSNPAAPTTTANGLFRTQG